MFFKNKKKSKPTTKLDNDGREDTQECIKQLKRKISETSTKLDRAKKKSKDLEDYAIRLSMIPE